ncbi:U1 small nuclear ribonucleoprotein 70 kDa-like [Dysidea avara]|uniref:U1 small nuclear ribonucleoprotein 70 kDa-like n=1 Tax=Dysidea avara TaxID=196820 RepID=UPI00332E1C9E
MTQFLPPNLLALFAPREPIPYLAPLDKLPHEKKPWPYTGVSDFLQEFEDPADTPPPRKIETREERKERKRKQREERYKEKLDSAVADWDPSSDPNVSDDPFRTLFIGRINYDTPESKIRREFESYGPIKRIRMIFNAETSKPRGYAFIEYEHERDMRAAYKYADGKKINDRRVVVDVERGRTVKGWKPRRLGGGLGGSRRGAPTENIKYSGRVDDRDRDKDRNRDRDRDHDRERRRDRSHERRRSHSRDRGSSRRERSRSRERRDRDKKDRDNERGRDRDREKDSSKDKEREKDRKEKDKDKEKEKDRDREKDKDKDKDKDRDRDKEKAKEKDSSSKEKDKEKSKEKKEKKDKKDRDKEKKHKDKDKERSKDKKRSDKHRSSSSKNKDDAGTYEDDEYEEHLPLSKDEPMEEGECYDQDAPMVEEY